MTTSRPLFWTGLLAAVLLLLLARIAAAQEGTSGPMPKDIRFEPHFGAAVPLDVDLVDEEGRSRALGDLVTSRPVVLVMAYYECPMLCSLVLNGLFGALKKTELAAGEDFQVVVVSIDPADTPERAAAKKATYVRYFGRPGAEEGIHFLTGRAGEVRRLADAIGFLYAYDPIGKQFAHPGGVTLLTGQGVISHYFYGVDFPPRDLRLGLVEAGRGQVGTARDRLLLLCFHYDPAQGRYGAAALGAVRVAGALTVFLMVAALVAMRRRKAG